MPSPPKRRGKRPPLQFGNLRHILFVRQGVLRWLMERWFMLKIEMASCKERDEEGRLIVPRNDREDYLTFAAERAQLRLKVAAEIAEVRRIRCEICFEDGKLCAKRRRSMREWIAYP